MSAGLKIRKELWFGFILMALIIAGTLVMLLAAPKVSTGHLGLMMLALVVVVAIMLGFPAAFTLMGMGMGMIFTWIAYEQNTSKTLTLMVQAAFKVMGNDVLISIPLFVFMGYLVERANLIEKLFKSLHLAMARVPGSLAVATLFTCAVFATATGIVGAVVTLMGLLALPQMLRGGYDVRVSAGAITAGGCLGILIPPSVMLIVYGATAGVSVVQLYAGAFLPGIMLAGLYMLYIIVLAWFKPHLMPPLSAAERFVPLPALTEPIARQVSNTALPALLKALKGGRNLGVPTGHIVRQLGVALLPMLIFGAALLLSWHVNTAAPDADALAASARSNATLASDAAGTGLQAPPGSVTEPAAAEAGLAEPPAGAGLTEPPKPDGGSLAEPPKPEAGGLAEPPGAAAAVKQAAADSGLKAPPGSETTASAAASRSAPTQGWWIGTGVGVLALLGFYAVLSFQRLEIFKMLLSSFFPLLVLILAVLGSIVMGLATPTEAAAVGALGGFLLAVAYRQFNMGVLKESVFLTAKTSAMVCWLFVGSAIFSAAFALLGGQELVERWVLSMNLSKTQFLVLSQVIIFILGWPLERGRDHRHLHAHLHPAARQVRRRPAVLRPAGGAEPADRLPEPAGGDGRLLPEGREPAACHAEPDLLGHAALHGHPGAGHRAALPVPGHRPVVAAAAVQPGLTA